MCESLDDDEDDNNNNAKNQQRQTRKKDRPLSVKRAFSTPLLLSMEKMLAVRNMRGAAMKVQRTKPMAICCVSMPYCSAMTKTVGAVGKVP